MAGSVNKVIILGNLGRDPEIRSTNDGRRIANLNVATSETWKDKATGEHRERTEWHRVVIFNEGLAEVAEKYLRKGSKVYLEGAIQTRKWQDQQGAERYSTEIVLQQYRGQLVLLGDGSGNRPPPADSADDYGHPAQTGGSNNYATRHGLGKDVHQTGAKDLDDEIPF